MKTLSDALQQELLDFLSDYIAGKAPGTSWAKGLYLQVARKRTPRTASPEALEGSVESVNKNKELD